MAGRRSDDDRRAGGGALRLGRRLRGARRLGRRSGARGLPSAGGRQVQVRPRYPARTSAASGGRRLAGGVLQRIGWERRARDFLLRRLPSGSVGAEVGVFRGDFSERILRIVRPRTLHLIDPWRVMSGPEFQGSPYGSSAPDVQTFLETAHGEVLRRFDGRIHDGSVVVHAGTSAETAADLVDGTLDWVYLDGDHRYEAVRDDLALFRRKVRPGGLLAGDDYDRPGSWWHDGVTRAVDEFVAGGLAERLLERRHQFLLRNRAVGPAAPGTVPTRTGSPSP